MKKLLIIPCCAKKRRCSLELFEKEVKISYFIDHTLRLLNEGRSMCQKDIIEDCTSISALSMYNGFLYNKQLKELIREKINPNFHVLIISASYGILRPEERIKYYNRKMSDNYSIWRNVIPAILEEYIINNKIGEVYGFFGSSTTYLKIVEQCNWDLLKSNGLEIVRFISPFKNTYLPKSSMQGVSEFNGKLIVDLIESDFSISIDESKFKVLIK